MEERLALPGGADRAAPGEVWRVLRRNRWLIAACTVLALGVGYALARRIDAVYESTARIYVETKPSVVTSLSASGTVPDENRIATEMGLLQSHDLAASVVDSLQLQLQVLRPRSVVRSELFSAIRISPDAGQAEYEFARQDDGRFQVTDHATGARVGTVAPGGRIRLPQGEVALAPMAARHPEFAVAVDSRTSAANQLSAAVRISQPDRNADVIQMEYSGRDPELTRDVPNVLAARFIEVRRDMRTAEARRTAEFLRRQLDTLRGQLTTAEDRLRSFREREQVVDLPVEASTQVAQRAQMEAQRGSMQAESRALGQMLAQARSARRDPGGPSPYRRLVAFPTLLHNEAASGILASLAKVEDDRAALLTRRKPNDPDVQVLTRRINELEDQLAAIVSTYQQGLSNQVASIDATMGTFDRRLNQIPSKELEYARLARQTKVLDDTYGLLQTRLKEAEITQAVQDPSVRVMDAAQLPGAPGNPKGKLLVGFSALFGLLFGVALSFVREYRDGSVRSREDLQAATGLPVLGWIPRMEALGVPGKPGVPALRVFRGLLPGRESRALAPAAGGRAVTVLPLPAMEGPAVNGQAWDAYEWLHRNLLYARPDEELKTLMFASPLPGDGKTTSAAGLAVTLARRGLKVLLVDADLRRGTLSHLFGKPRKEGLADLLAGTASFQETVRTVDVGGGNALHYLPTGMLPADPTRLLGSSRAAALFEWLEEKYYLVILDCPPLNVFADAAVLGPYTDGVVLVARAGVTPFEALVDAAEQCRRAKLPVLGTLLNDINPERDREYDAAYRWYEYGKQYYAAAND
ncbi:MAG: polysaccharide biosynthesis tyrosine autokinase [Gemmatimonadetes bacterium]|nr:polysaccharide biosynthesis tyrosine autokinase [Gemmatimonadota bacterium]